MHSNVTPPEAGDASGGIPEATVARLPVYLRALYGLAERGISTVASEELAAAATELSTKIGGVLNLGCLTTLYPLLMPELLHAFKERHGSVRIESVAADQRRRVMLIGSRSGQGG